MISEKEVKSLKGLSQEEAASLLKRDGFNELPDHRKRTLLRILWEALTEPMFLLLLGCGTIYFTMGDLAEALVLLLSIFFMIGITLYQEGKSEKTVEALRDLSSPRAQVIRDGVSIRIPGREVVQGDIIIIQEGDRIPADALLIWGNHVRADESMLTGESMAVSKTTADPKTPMGSPGGDGIPFLFSGTLLVQGHGIALVKNTGIHTEMGKIGQMLKEIEPEKTLLQLETRRLVMIIFSLAVVLCLTVIGFQYAYTHSWMQGLLTGLTLAMAIIPEEFPFVLTIFFALGAWRISRNKVLTRRMSAIETLGAATVLCSDKTGTITENKMRIVQLVVEGQTYDLAQRLREDLPETYHELIEYGILASQRDPFDPMEKAFQDIGEGKLAQSEHLHQSWKLIREYPLSPELLSIVHVWESTEGGDFIIGAKGAPESIFDLCHIPPEREEALSEAVASMAVEGLRVLGVAKGVFSGSKLPSRQHDFDFSFIGLVGFEDPIRPTVPDAIRECYSAGIRVVMITGDYPVTAQNIARQIGLRDTEQVITGTELAYFLEEELQEKIKKVSIFARVLPHQKLKIVELLKEQGQIVAMTGDGVNDAAALKSAHIGIAMGERGTDVAREASSMVLLDDSFPSIVAAIRLGRRIYDNLKKAMSYIVSVHIPIAGAALIPAMLNWPVELLTAVHVVFLEMLIDPTCSVVFESQEEEADIMSRNPRVRTQPLFTRETLAFSITQGIIALLLVVGAFFLGLWWELDKGNMGTTAHLTAKTLAFVSLIGTNIGLIMVNRDWKGAWINEYRHWSPALRMVVAGAISFLLLVIYVPFLQDLFGFVALRWSHWGMAGLIFLLGIVLFEGVKRAFSLLTSTP